MRRKSERTASKKAKPSPEKKATEKLKRTRTSKRRKQSTSSEESAEDTSPPCDTEAKIVEPEKKPPQTPTKEKEVSAEDAHEVWHVKTAEVPSDTGEIQKLKICLTRPPSTPERVDRSPRSRRKHSRATSSSDTPSVEAVEDRKKSKHRSKRAARESRDEPDQNQDSQGDEAEVDSEMQPATKDDQITQSTEAVSKSIPDETPMSTTGEEHKTDETEKPTESEKPPIDDQSKESDVQGKSSDADTTVASPKAEDRGDQVEDSKQSDEGSSTQCEAKMETQTTQEAQVTEERSDKNKTTDNKSETSESKPETEDSKEQSKGTQEKEEVTTEQEVSKSEDSSNNSKTEEPESSQNENQKANDNDVVDSFENIDKERRRSVSPDSVKPRREERSKERRRSRELERSESTQSAKDEPIQNGQAAPIVISRKRRWGSRSSKLTTQKSITISTDILKEIIPDVKPVEFEEVIEEKKQHKRIQSNEKLERPVLPKIVIDNTEHMEHYKKEYEERESENIKSREPLAANRRISIVKENDSIIARPPSPPRHKQSCILYITNLVRPFTLPQLKNLLQRTGRISEEGFWIDRIKSKCFVKYETEDQAVETRHALHGVTWPVSNPKTLQVDFSSQEAFDKAKANEDTDNAQATTIPGTVEDWLREQDMKRERGEMDKPWERKAAVVREWDFGKNDKDKDKERPKRDERILEKRRHRTPERSPEPAKKFKKKEEEAPAKLLDDLFRKTKATPCIYWLPLSLSKRSSGVNTWQSMSGACRSCAARIAVTSMESRVLVSGELMEFLNTSNPILSADREYILAPSEVEQVYRYSTTAKFALYEIATQEVTLVADHQRLQLCIFGGGHSLAYVLDNNVYYLPENSSEAIQLTDDGIPGVIYNGHADWVYEEDVMYTGQATWFNPDGSYLAFASYNDTEVESYSYYYFVDKSDPEDLYPELVDLKYPKTIEAPEAVTDDHILGGIIWPTTYEIAAHWLNRRQNYTVLSNGDFYVSTRWSMEQADGNIWQHLYLSMRVNGEIISSSITPGAFTVNNYVGMDESTLSYYFTRTVTDSPWQSQVHVVGAQARCLSCSLVLPDGGPCTWATATASRAGAFMTITCSSPNEPSATFIINPRDNAIVRNRLIGKNRPGSIITTVPLENGFPAPVRLFLPPGLDVNDPDTKYAMVFYVYSGPNTNTVYDTFTVGYHSYLTTSRNVIYMLADGRGSGLKGQDILYSLNNKLGTVEIEDHFVILRQVLERYAFIDPSRVGIWGHSYGGYATLLTLLHDDDHLFQCGRYMGLPTEEDNLAGYEAGDVTLLVDKLRGHDFYLMHGNADDNVHYQNAAKLMRALQERDIPFEQMSYPDEAHSLVGVNMHRYNAMNQYWAKCLRLGSAPQAVLKTFTLEELIPLKVDFYPDKLFGEWISDSEFVSKDGAGMYNLSTNGYSVSALSKDLKYLLLTSQVMKVYRYSRIAVYSVYDLESKSINKIGKGPLQAAVWGKGRSLAYIQNNNVYYVPDVTLPAVTTLTTEGVLGEVYFGVADWIYEEEILNAAEALWFSPHGTSLAVAYFNDTLVESASYPIYGDPFDPMNQYPETMSFKYPKAGRVNPMVGLKVFKLGNPSSEARIIPAPVDVIGLDHILGRVSWASDQNLIVLWLNRRQNISILVNCDLTKDKCNLLQQQTEPNGWIDINEPFFDSTGNKMLDIQHMYSGERRFPHATIFNFNTSETEDLSPGNLTVTEILGWNEEKNTVYFIVSPGNLPWQRQLWSSTGGAMRCVSCQQPSCSNVDPMFSPGASFGILSCSSTNVPPKTDSFKLLKDNFKLSEKFSKYNLPMALFNTISLGDDVMANVKLLLPPVIEKGQKYPMVVQYYNTYLAANRSFIVASIDVRGSKVLGVEAMHAVNNALGTVEDLETKYSFKDPKRVGVWNWRLENFNVKDRRKEEISVHC
ncbi:hypothetical protein MSG28_002118 [Choristoneura fumiferana]|uniref:Uncharacterized protein n=1 Tax=Choristoneura fumiferana TaxID=7141 RepID=A0ACC0JU72_CHOFU|nr:hypothetical protein MSG28_002118 [Choristoneura fumiferana]